jgi:hypothetical protein
LQGFVEHLHDPTPAAAAKQLTMARKMVLGADLYLRIKPSTQKLYLCESWDLSCYEKTVESLFIGNFVHVNSVWVQGPNGGVYEQQLQGVFQPCCLTFVLGGATEKTASSC